MRCSKLFRELSSACPNIELVRLQTTAIMILKIELVRLQTTAAMILKIELVRLQTTAPMTLKIELVRCVPHYFYVLFTVQVVTSFFAEPRPTMVINALHQYTRMRMNIPTVMVCHTSACLCTRLLWPDSG